MLFTPLTLGEISLSNRVVMAPLTRSRTDVDGVPNDLLVEHYKQRASIGLIVTEGTYPSQAGRGFVGQPGLVTDEQLAGWARVTEAVHAEGGKIVAQVMHAGRVTHPDTNGGLDVVAPSAIAVQGETRTYKGKQPYTVPVALTQEGISQVINDFVTASKAAINAGFDGVEMHSANGYLLHEFLAPSSNHRDDIYGGSPENRARFVIELTKAVVAAVGAEKVGIRISPAHNIQGAVEADLEDLRATYLHLVNEIAPLGLAYLSVLHAEPAAELVQELRSNFGGPFLVNSGFSTITTAEEAREIVSTGLADAVVVGRPAIANPDLPRRWQENLPLNEPDFSTFYTPGAKGYTDYPFYQG
ncbi:alkene reductase [Pseudarthrobacter sp. J1738]|uniref:alkene reductase n=1 Tax=unclassified Pseudarthrobacter TaxID=2647000 RepID=UPI003D27B3AF